jgi:hypothetical protein
MPSDWVSGSPREDINVIFNDMSGHRWAKRVPVYSRAYEKMGIGRRKYSTKSGTSLEDLSSFSRNEWEPAADNEIREHRRWRIDLKVLLRGSARQL